MAHQQTRARSHAEFRPRSQLPLPAVDEVEQRLMEVLSPALLAPRQLARREPRHPPRLIRLRQRLLTLPVMVARLVSLGWRRMPSIAAGQQGMAREGLLGLAPLPVSPQAITKRLDGLPAALMGQVFTAVCTRLQAQPLPLPQPRWAPVWERFPRGASVEGSTLEARRNKAQSLRQREGLVLAGKMMVMVEAFSHRPLWPLYTAEAQANETRFAAGILAVLPVGGLVVCALGFFSFPWFDDLTDQAKDWVPRMRGKTAYRTVQGLSQELSDRDAIIPVGQYRWNPGVPPLRMVSVRWQGVWYRYLTKVLHPQVVSARQVCGLYRRRWRSEDACALTNRLLDWASLGTGAPNAVQLQIYATLLFSAGLVTIGPPVAPALGEPWERISVARVCRACHHDRRAMQRGEGDELVPFWVAHANLLGLVTRWRQQHRDRHHLESIIWGDP